MKSIFVIVSMVLFLQGVARASSYSLPATDNTKTVQYWVHNLFEKEEGNGITKVEDGYRLSTPQGSIQSLDKGYEVKFNFVEDAPENGQRIELPLTPSKDSLQQSLWVYLSDEFEDGDYAPVDLTDGWFAIYDGKTYIGCHLEKSPTKQYQCEIRFDGSHRRME